jgi:hypothetical protein
MTKKIMETSMDIPAGTGGKNAGAGDRYHTGGIIFQITGEEKPA